MKNSLKNAEIVEIVSYDSTTGYHFTMPAIDESLELNEENEKDCQYVSNLEINDSLYRLTITPLYYNIYQNGAGVLQGYSQWSRLDNEFRTNRFFKDEESLNKAVNLLRNVVDVERGDNFCCVHYLELDIDKLYVDEDVKEELNEIDERFFWEIFEGAPTDESEKYLIRTLFEN